MANRERIMRAFNVNELSLIEDALQEYIGSGGFSDHILENLISLLDDVTFARRMLHQLGKSDHRDR